MTTPQDHPRAVLARLAAHAPHPPLHPAGEPNTPTAGASCQQLLYYSQARAPWSEVQLVALLEQARAYNQAHAITGVLLYQGDRFIQFLEGDASVVQALYARIQADPRHRHVAVAHQQITPTRFFADWATAFATPEQREFYWLLAYREARQHRLLVPQVSIT